MIKFSTYSQTKRGQEIGGFYLYSPDELLEDAKGKELEDMDGEKYIKVYGGFSVWNIRDHGLVVERSPLNDCIGEGGLYYNDIYFKINDSPNAHRQAWFKTREGAQRFLDKYGKRRRPRGECLSLLAPSIMIFNE